MRPGFGMKRKIIIIAVILVVVSISIYIWASTAIIDEMAYRERAYAITNFDRNIIHWEDARVYLVKLREEPCRTFGNLNARINRYLLFLNGGYAVKVEFRTYYDGVLGPLVLYINPFTKQLIGIAPRF